MRCSWGSSPGGPVAVARVDVSVMVLDSSAGVSARGLGSLREETSGYGRDGRPVDLVDCWIVDTTAPHVPVLRPVRGLLVVFGVLTFLAVAALFVRPETTDRYFAWTIRPPLTAAFLGGAYLAGLTLVVLSLRASAWVHARAAIATILVFTVLTLIATLAHIDRFHLAAGGPAARAAAWFWLAVYVVVPVVMVVLLVLQYRAPGTHPARTRPLPRWLTVLLLAEGVTMFAVGTVLFVSPGLIGWPWPLSALTSRAIGAWLVSFGLAAGLAVAERDLDRLRAPTIAYLVFGVAELAALARFADTLAWDDPAAWVYLGALVLVVLTGAAGVRLAVGRPA